MSISVLPVITLLARETFQVVDVGLCSHHHFESWDHFVTCTAIPSGSKEPGKICSYSLSVGKRVPN